MLTIVFCFSRLNNAINISEIKQIEQKNMYHVLENSYIIFILLEFIIRLKIHILKIHNLLTIIIIFIIITCSLKAMCRQNAKEMRLRKIDSKGKEKYVRGIKYSRDRAFYYIFIHIRLNALMEWMVYRSFVCSSLWTRLKVISLLSRLSVL